MKNILNIFMLLSLMSMPTLVDAQDEAITITPTDQPYPAGNQPTNGTMAAFISIFDDTNVGNLHVYAPTQSEPSMDYFYHGTDITGSFDEMLPRKLKRTLRRKGSKLYATRNIRGVNGEYYILRTTDRRGHPTLDLYELQGTKLVKVMTLANAKCKKSGGCRQLNSWIQDVNGDTRLDIIQKESKNPRKVMVYTQNRAGKFVRNNSVDVDGVDYQLESK